MANFENLSQTGTQCTIAAASAQYALLVAVLRHCEPVLRQSSIGHGNRPRARNMTTNINTWTRPRMVKSGGSGVVHSRRRRWGVGALVAGLGHCEPICNRFLKPALEIGPMVQFPWNSKKWWRLVIELKKVSKNVSKLFLSRNVTWLANTKSWITQWK